MSAMDATSYFCDKCEYIKEGCICKPVVNHRAKKEPYGKCPECGCKDIDVYLIADYNSTIDSINCEGHVEWYYSDAMTDMYCKNCDAEFKDAKEVKDGQD